MNHKLKSLILTGIMCAALTACGTSDETVNTTDQIADTVAATAAETNRSTAGSTAETECVTGTSEAVMIAADKAEESEAANTEADLEPDSDNIIEVDGMTIKLHANHFISLNENDIEAEPTGEELYIALNAALAQYRAAEAKDPDAYIRSFRFAGLAEPTADILRDMYQHPDDDLRDYLNESGLGAKYELIDDMVSLIAELIDDKYKERFELIEETYRPESHDETVAFLNEAFSGIAADTKQTMDNIEYETIFDSEEGVDPLDGISDSTVYSVYIEHCSRENTEKGSNVFMNCMLIIDTAEKEYTMNRVYFWLIDGQCGVCIDERMRTGNIPQEIKGKTAEEIFVMLKNENA